MMKHSTKSRSLVAHALRASAAALLIAVGFGALATGCLDRPVSPVSPNTTNIFVDRITVYVVDKIDLLFMIDNSISMADKQEMLREAVPQLLNRLIDPVCVEPGSEPPVVVQETSQNGCPEGSEPEFNAVQDIHIGVITSSLGGNGGRLCTPDHGGYWNETQNDRGRLISRQGPSQYFDAPPTTWNDMGFLSWDPESSARNPEPIPGESDPTPMVDNFQNLVTGAGEQGCGYEASLEAWYRFLVDPDPPLDVLYDEARRESVGVGVDDVVLAQRAQFLRPDSLVAIIMLSDENDCSVIDHGIGYWMGDTDDGAMPRATSQCDADPNDPCCLSCIQANWPNGCSDPRSDPNCQAGWFHGEVDDSQDRLNLRCYDQKRRFGLNFLHPTSRYVTALTSHELTTRAGEPAVNPLFAANEEYYPDLVPRLDNSLIFLAGLVGVPWQDIATDDSLDTSSETMRYLRADEISARGIWDQILGQPDASPPVAPSDPFMVESVAPRSGVNPRTQIAISPPVPGPGGNPINGHEYRIDANSDLQYACIYPLATHRDCATPQPGEGCDCKTVEGVSDRPLCNDTTQEYAKAYPGTRFLEVLRDYGTNSIVASICPKHPSCDDPNNINCGYNPAVAAIIDRLKSVLKGTCLPRELATDSNGLVLCQVVEVSREPNPAPCGDGLPGRSAVEQEVRDAILAKMQDLEMCGGETTPCSLFSLCQLTPAAENVNEPAYQECLRESEANIQSATGYCYIDGMTDFNQDGVVNCTSECYSSGAEGCDCLGNPEFVVGCEASQRRLLRFVSPANAEQPLPWPNSTVFVACQGVAFRTD